MSSRTDLRVSSPAEGPLPPDTAERGTMATRTLSACVHLSDRFCDVVQEHFRIKPNRAMAPSYSVDAITVVGHARSAQRHQVARDVMLFGLLIGGVLTIWGALPPAQRPLLVVLSVGILVAISALSRWFRHHMKQRTTLAALKVYYSTRRRTAAEHLSVLLVAGVTVLAVFLSKVDLKPEIIRLAVLLAAAWVVVAGERNLSLYVADLVTRSKYPAHTGAVTLPAKLREDHARIQSPERNLIVYNSTANFHDTFVGCGEPLDPHVINIDASLGRHDKNGNRLSPRRVNVRELHLALQRAVLAVGAPGCWGGHRTYVDGRNIRAAPWNEDRSFDPLDVMIDEKLALPNPRTEHLPGRTYLCIQITTWDGDLVVTLFVRATLIGANLHLHHKVYVLAPLANELQATVRHLPRYGLRRTVKAAAYATRNVIPKLLNSPRRCAQVPGRILRRDLQHAWDRWQIRHGEDYDHGAAYSAREDFADTQMIHADAWDDVVQQVNLLQTSYISALQSYLESHDIDTGSLSESLKTLHLHQATSFTIDKVHNLSTGPNAKSGDEHYFHQPPSDRPAPAGEPNNPER